MVIGFVNNYIFIYMAMQLLQKKMYIHFKTMDSFEF